MSETPAERTHRLNKNRTPVGLEGAGKFGTSPTEAAVPNKELAAPESFEHDGSDVTVYRVTGNTFMVRSDEYLAEFVVADGADVKKAATTAIDHAILESKQAEFDELGGRGVQLADSIDFYQQRLGISSSAFEHIAPGDEEYFSGDELNDNAIDFINVQRTDDDNDDPSHIFAEAGVTLNFEDWAEGCGVEDTDKWLNENQNEIDMWIRHNYDDLRLDGGGGDQWSSQQLTTIVDWDNEDDTPRTMIDMETAVIEQTKLSDLHNDLNGAYGTGHSHGFWGRLELHLEGVADGSIQSLQ
jgi:hypothetical protein